MRKFVQLHEIQFEGANDFIAAFGLEAPKYKRVFFNAEHIGWVGEEEVEGKTYTAVGFGEEVIYVEESLTDVKALIS